MTVLCLTFLRCQEKGYCDEETVTVAPPQDVQASFCKYELTLDHSRATSNRYVILQVIGYEKVVRENSAGAVSTTANSVVGRIRTLEARKGARHTIRQIRPPRSRKVSARLAMQLQ